MPGYTFGVVVIGIHNDVAIHSSRGISLWKLLAFGEGFLDEISSDENQLTTTIKMTNSLIL